MCHSDIDVSLPPSLSLKISVYMYTYMYMFIYIFSSGQVLGATVKCGMGHSSEFG